MSKIRERSSSPTKDKSIPLGKKYKTESSLPQSLSPKSSLPQSLPPQSSPPQSLPPKSIKIFLRKQGFLQQWEKITEPNKSKRYYYYNCRTRKSMYTTPYKDIKDKHYSSTIVQQVLETYGPDKTIDYLIELLESYIFYVYETKKRHYRFETYFNLMYWDSDTEAKKQPSPIVLNQKIYRTALHFVCHQI